MARKRVVSRNVRSTLAKVLCTNVETESCEVIEIELPHTYKDEKLLMKAIKLKLDSKTVIPVRITGTEIIRTLYSMPEEKFLATAEKIKN